MNHIEPHIKAVLMDFDDTLVGTIEPKWRQHKFIAKTYYGKELTDAELAKHWGKPLSTYLSLIYDTEDTETALSYIAKHRHEYPVVRFEGTVPFLRNLKNSGLLTGLVTASNRNLVLLDLEIHNIPKEYIDYIQTADDTDYHKPDKRVFIPALKWLSGHHIEPKEVLYIGDGLHDMKAASDTGFNFLGVETGLTTQHTFSKHGAKSIPHINTLAPQVVDTPT